MNSLIKLIFGPEVALALKLIKSGFLLVESLQSGLTPNVAPFARDIFKHLPASFKAPVGPAAEQEFVDAIFNVFSLFLKPKRFGM